MSARALITTMLILLSAGSVRADEGRAALMAAHRGGEMRLLARSPAGSIDPQINDTGQYWQMYAAVYDGLLATRKADGAAGQEIVPDLAEAMPELRDGGRSYVFRLRSGVRFSDGRPVRPADVVTSFRRLFAVAGPTAGSFYDGIVGADACLKAPAGCELPGVSADEAAGTVTIRLVRPDPEFPIKLTLPPASVLPADVPARDSGTTPLPGTGPYRIASYDPGTALRLERNPFFREWSEAAQPDGFPDTITESFGLPDEAAMTQVENGQADWMFDAPPADRLAELGTNRAQVHVNRALALRYMVLNTRLPPFDDPRVRRAVNLAISRDAAVLLFGGRNMAEPTCQVLPPGLSGYVRYCPYPHDMAQARALVAESGTAGQRVTIVTDDSPVQRATGAYVQSVLRDLGYQAALRTLSGHLEFTYIQNSGNKVQAALTDWYSDYPAPSDFLKVLFACDAFHPNSDASLNMSGFCDRGIDARMAEAMAVPDPEQAAPLWAAIDRAVTDAAPIVPLLVPRTINVASARVGHFLYNIQFRWLVAQSWVR